MPWSARFHDPIQPPKGKPLLTLKDAADYIKKVHDTPHWQLAMDMRAKSFMERDGPATVLEI